MNYELALLNKKMDSFSEYLNKFVNSSLRNQQEISLEEFIYVLTKILCGKDQIIKKLVETQSTVLDTISAKSNNQHSNTLNQSSFSLPSNSFDENSHNTKQFASQEQQDPHMAIPCSSQLQVIAHPIQTHHQR